MTRNPVAMVLAGTLVGAATLGFGAPQAGNTLVATLAAMDKASAKFKGLTADLRNQSYNDVVEKTEIQEGTIAVKRFKPKDTRILVKFAKPAPSYHYLGEGKYLSFNPGTQEAQQADLGKSKTTVNTLMLLAFGSNSSDLQAAYKVSLGGPDTVNGEKTTRLEMIPKSPEILKYAKRCDMWVSDSGVIVQQKFYETGNDFVMFTYSHIVMTPGLPDSALKLDIPSGIKVPKLK
jgi:outer membrane lipoprotein-sorting protein